MKALGLPAVIIGLACCHHWTCLLSSLDVPAVIIGLDPVIYIVALQDFIDYRVQPGNGKSSFLDSPSSPGSPLAYNHSFLYNREP